MQPPLQLEESYFDIVNVEAIANHKPAAQGTPLQHEIVVQLNLATVDNQPGLWQVTLDIAGKADASAPPPYRFHLRGVGVFRYTGDDQPEPEIARVVGINGAPIVFSSAREYLMLITSRGPWGQLRLPAMSFADLEVAAADGKK